MFYESFFHQIPIQTHYVNLGPTDRLTQNYTGDAIFLPMVDYKHRFFSQVKRAVVLRAVHFQRND